MSKDKQKETKKLYAVVISLLFMLILAVVPAEKTQAAETQTIISRTHLTDANRIFPDKFNAGTVLTDNYQEKRVGTEEKYYIYTAKEDVEVTIEITDQSYHLMYINILYIWSGNYGYEDRYSFTSDAEKIFLKKGEFLKVRMRAESGFNGANKMDNESYVFHFTATPARKVSSVRAINGTYCNSYIEFGGEFDSTRCPFFGKIEVTYTDGSKEERYVGDDFSWKVDVLPVTSEVGTYTYHVYFRDVPIKFVHENRSLDSEIPMFPQIQKDEKVYVANTGKNYVGFSFVPDKNGYYNLRYDAATASRAVMIKEDGGRILCTGGSRDKKFYMLEGVEYKLYASYTGNDEGMYFWLEDGLSDVSEEFEVEDIGTQWYADGQPICPTPVLKQDGEILKPEHYYCTYYRNDKLGTALVVVEREYMIDGISHRATIYVPFKICKKTEQATGSAIIPKERATIGDQVLVNGKDYTVACTKIKSLKSKGKGKLVIKLAKVADANGYEISYSTDKKFQKNVKAKTTKKKKVVIKKLKKKTTYYVRVRTYRKVGGETLYSKYSKVRKIKVK